MKKLFNIVVFGVFVVLSVSAQQRFSGRVVTEDEEPLIGASVQVDGTTLATVTDELGHFELRAEANATLTVSYAGYVTRQVAASQGMQVVLEKDKNIHRTTAHRFALGLSFGINSPLEAYTTQGKFGSYSYAAGGLSLGYQIRHKRLLSQVGVEAMFRGYSRDFKTLMNTPMDVMVREIRLMIPLQMGMELSKWYWLLGAKVGFYDVTFLDVYNGSHSKTHASGANFSFAPAAEIGLNFDRPQNGTNYKLALFAEAHMDPKLKKDMGYWWLHTVMGVKFTVALDAQ